MAPAHFSEEEIGALLHKIQVYVLPRRVRVKEFFVDCDKLNCNRCTKENMNRALNLIGCLLVPEEVDALCDYFTENGPTVKKPKVVNYSKFCQVIDEAFKEPLVAHGAHESQHEMLISHMTSAGDEERFQALLQRLSSLCQSRGVVFKVFYMDCDRSPSASPARMNPRYSGKVTNNQFLRNFPFKKEFTEEEVSVLASRYNTPNGDVNFVDIAKDVSEVTSNEPPPFPRSEFFPKPDSAVWTKDTLTPQQKMKAKILEKRLQILERFQDFDALRKGFCTVGQVKAVFTILNLTREIERHDFDELINQYTREDGMFFYRQFCQDVDHTNGAAITLKKDPRATIEVPDERSTMAARRSYQVLSAETQKAVAELEEKVKYQIQSRRMNLWPPFQDMDKKNWSHVSRDQFTRVMYSHGFELNEASIDLLCSKYCDLGNRVDFNHRDFLKTVDVPSDEFLLALSQRNTPITGREAVGPRLYFDESGSVIPIGSQ